jgi:hypothetical protein
MACPLRKWQPGTTVERPKNTESVKELQGRLASMNAERSKQDRMWEEPAQPQSNIQQKQNQVSKIENGSFAKKEKHG